jgi:DNA-binding GntR family transcriptional regulator
MKNFERPKSLTELVSETLRDWIISGDLELGSQLSEARIASEMQVSRTPVREAINRLEMEGLLIVEPQRGSFVFSLEPTELAKLCDAQQLGECVDKMTAARAADDVPTYLQLDSRFHQILLDESDNRFLNDAYQTIAQKMSALRNRLGRHPDHMAKSYREHIEMRDAVAARDTDKALAILRDHIGQNEGSYWKMATSR